MSALLVLHSEPGDDGRFYDTHWREFQPACEELGVQAQRGLGVYFDRTMFMASEMGSRARHRNISLNDGDFYVFNSNRLHEIFPVRGSRVTVGTFIGVDDSSILMY